MKTQLAILSKTAGWIAFSLGLVHTANTIFVIGDIAGLENGWKGIFLFMYVGTGLGCLLAGSSMLLSTANGIRDFMASNLIFLVSSAFMLLVGAGAPIAMSDNPFGYISLGVGVFALVVALLRLRELQVNK